MSRTGARILYFVSLIGGLLLMALFMSLQMKFLAYIALAATFVGMFISLRSMRCPSCGWMPGKHGLFAQYCPRCGEMLD